MGQAAERRAVRLFIVAGEHSGDALGGLLMAALKSRTGGAVEFAGVGGESMHSQGLVSLYPFDDIAVMGLKAILARLPLLARRVYDTVRAAVETRPDAVVIIDAPEFTHRVARRIRRRAPEIPIIDYVSPSVWAWRSGRARKMKAYVDHVLALLPFEPAAHARFGGPPCSYVGHPLIEHMDEFRNADADGLAKVLRLDSARPVLTVLPGSRRSEVTRLMEPFGDALRRLDEAGQRPEVIVPVVGSVRPLVEAGLATWPRRPHLVSGTASKLAAFRLSRAALAASGTVTLELGLSGVPAVVAYKVDRLIAPILRRTLKVPSVVLANLVAGENIYPEFHQEACTPEALAGAMAPLLRDTPERARQVEGLTRIPERMAISGASPSEMAADIVLHYADAGRTG